MPHHVPYVAIYRASIASPDSELTVELSDVRLTVRTGPFSFSHAVPIKSLGPNRSMIVLGENHVNIPQGCYIVIETTVNPEEERGRVALRVAEVAGLITLRFPHVLDEKLYEGPINTEYRSLLWSEGPITLTVSPTVASSQLFEGLTDDLCSIQQLNGKGRDRFQLASRWYRRGHESVNLVDRLLFWWTVLEIYPGAGKTNIVKNTKQVLRDQVCPQLTLAACPSNL